jgi:hypothetical protein
MSMTINAAPDPSLTDHRRGWTGLLCASPVLAPQTVRCSPTTRAVHVNREERIAHSRKAALVG